MDIKARIIAAGFISLAFHVALVSLYSGGQKGGKTTFIREKRVTLSLSARRVKPALPPVVRPKEIDRRKMMPAVVKQIKEIPAPLPAPMPRPSTPGEIVEVKMPEHVMVSEFDALPSIEEVVGDVKEESSVVENNSSRAGLLPIVEARPLYKENPPPQYPLLARKRRYQGTVVLEVLVSEQGRVNDRKIMTSSGYKVLDRAALKAVKNWLFEAGSRDGKAIEMWVRVPVRFILR